VTGQGIDGEFDRGSLRAIMPDLFERGAPSSSDKGIVGRTAANRAGICQKLGIPLPAGKTATKINQSYVALDHDHGNSASLLPAEFP
jgi:hypothetical protein